MDSTAIGLPYVVEQVNFLMPIIMSAAMFIITQAAKAIPALKNWKPDMILWPLALVGTFTLAYFYQPDMTVAEVWTASTYFVGTAGAIHLGKKLVWDNFAKAIALFFNKSGR
jgi:hypothetical protein